MDQTLNLVYDDWDINSPKPNPNGEKWFPSEDDWAVGDVPMEALKFRNYRNCRMEEVEKHPEKNFFYIVWHRHSLYNRFFSLDKIPIGLDIIGLIKRHQNLYLLLINEQEYEHYNSYKKVEGVFGKYDLDLSKIFFVTNNSRAFEYKKELGLKINVHSTRAEPLSLLKVPLVDYTPEKNGALFMCHNHSLREHRLGLICLLKKYDLLENFDWSYLRLWTLPDSDPIPIFGRIFNQDDIKILTKEISFLINHGTKKSKYEEHFSWLDDKIDGSPSWWKTYNQEQYTNTYFNITTETTFLQGDIHITEKTFKPFIHLQFPMILSSQHHIKYVKEFYGLDFFDDIIDHSYDDIEDPRDRLFKFVEEIKRINDNKEFFIDFYKNNKERFIANRDLIYSTTNHYDDKFLNHLIRFNLPDKTLNLVYDNWDSSSNNPISGNSESLFNTDFHMVLDTVVKSLQIDKRLIRRFKIEDIEKYPEEKFFYFVSTIPGKISENIKAGKNPIDKKAIDAWRNFGNLSIMIMNEQESENVEILDDLDKWTKNLELNQKQLWVSNNNTKLQERKEKLGTDINVHSTVRLPNFTAAAFLYSTGKLDFKTEKDGGFFMCQNRRSRPHRYGILCILRKMGIIDDVDWSLVQGWQFTSDPNGWISQVLNPDDIEEMQYQIDYFGSIEQKKCRYEEKYTWFDDRSDTDNVPWNKTYDKDQLENSYFNLTTETEFQTDHIHISEKSFKGFYALQFPMILASPFHIKEIKKKYDFDFFDDVVDHSYDEETNHRERLFKFAKEVKRISDNKQFFIDFYKNNKDRFMENNRKVIELVSDKTDENFLKKLAGII